jgi:hypothetical protein
MRQAVASAVGERFVRALADKDSVALKQLLAPDVDFRAMTPAKFWESRVADVVVDDIVLGAWFTDERRIVDVLALDTGGVSSMERVAYRLRVERPDGEWIVEQQVYYQAVGDQITWLRLMCTGFLRPS